ADFAAPGENRRQFLRGGIDLPEPARAAGARGHADLAVLEPLDLTRLVLPARKKIGRLATVDRREQEMHLRVRARASDEGELPAVGGQDDVRLRAEVVD